MDTLADVASLQAHQPLRPLPVKGTSLESLKSVESASRVSPMQASLLSNPRASFDINMMDNLQPGRRTNFSTTSLSEAQKEQLTLLATYLADNPSAYESHVGLVNLLHQAFIGHVYPTSADGGILPNRDPASFELLDELRNARSTMEKLFAVGEAIWLEWVQDESMLARTTEERIDVIEKFRRAVTDEVGSSKLWAAYGDWVLECYQWANQASNTDAIDEDKLVGKEVFTSQMLLETWQEAIENTKHDLQHSHLVWNKHINVRISEFKSNISKDQATLILGLFEQRLKTPHVASSSTKQILSTFMNSHFSQEQYFEIMEDTARIMKDALKAIEERLPLETRIEEAQLKGDRNAEYEAFMTYIAWEQTPAKRKRLDFDMCNAVYQRAELRFPSDSTLWDDHIAFVLENGRASLSLCSRATKHCPWSGSLWSQYLLSSDRQSQTYEETESIKHKATSTGVLEAAGISEVLKVHAAWCSYLRRRAFRPERDEDDADIAEIGIRASMENLSNLGAKLGMDDVPDPSFRLQRIYINFLSEGGRWDNARREFDTAVPDYGKSWQFWMRFYHWEMKRWHKFATKDAHDEPLATASVPHLATAVLKLALEQEHLDYPEPIVEALLNHCEDFEDAVEIEACWLKVRKLEKLLAAGRQIEALQSVQFAAAQQGKVDQETDSRPSLMKRKRDVNDSEETLIENPKKSKIEDDAVETVEQTQPESLKRDREHAMILVENLPENVSEAKIRQYFSSCGVVKAWKMLENNTSATIEFDDDEAARYALSRDGQQFEDAIISVSLDTGSTIFLSNYSPETGDAEMRNLLEPYGEIISVRFPSLQVNKKRRFCYVQYKLPAEAQDAVNNLDGRDIHGLPLTCKISNPAIKKPRQETSVNDGRTVFVGGLNFKLSEQEVKKEFTKHGTIILMRMPLHESMKSRNKGIAFVTFSSTDEAESALAMNGQSLRGREIKVDIAKDNAVRTTRQSSSIAANQKVNGKAAGRSTSPAASAPTEPRSERTVFLTSIPDTINEARLRSAASTYGDVVKVILKTNHQGALIEYATVAQAGIASLALDGFEIADGKNMRVVNEDEMKQQGPEKKTEGFAPKSKPRTTTGAQPLSGSSGFVKRPSQSGNKARRGGNLGQRTAALHPPKPAGTHQSNGDASAQQEQPTNPAAKSNADFRALMGGATTASKDEQ